MLFFSGIGPRRNPFTHFPAKPISTEPIRLNPFLRNSSEPICADTGVSKRKEREKEEKRKRDLCKYWCFREKRKRRGREKEERDAEENEWVTIEECVK